MTKKEITSEIVGAIVNSLRTNKNGGGMAHCWDALDPEVRGMIRVDWALSIDAILREHIK